MAKETQKTKQEKVLKIRMIIDFIIKCVSKIHVTNFVWLSSIILEHYENTTKLKR